MVIITCVHKFYRSSVERRREGVLLWPPCQYKISKANTTFCDQSADPLVHSPARPVLLSLEPGWEVEMTHDHITEVYEQAASWRFRDLYMRLGLYYLIYRCAFSPRWAPHINQLSLCLLESSVWWENVTFPHSHQRVKCAASLPESLRLQLLTACNSRAGPRHFGALGEIRIWGPPTAPGIS